MARTSYARLDRRAPRPRSRRRRRPRRARRAMNRPAAMTLRPNPRQATADGLEAELLAANVRVERGALVPDALIVRGLGDPATLPAVRRPRHAAGPGEPGAGRSARPARRGPHRRRRRRTGRQDHRHRRAASVPTAWWSRSTSTAAACGSSPRRRRDSASTWCTRSSPTGTRCRSPRNASIGCCSTRRAAAWACCGDARHALAPRTSRRSGSWRRCNADLLAAAAALVRPGGVLVYSVCTLTRAETVDVDVWAEQHLDGFDPLVPPPARPGDRSGRRARLPAPAGSRHRRDVRPRIRHDEHVGSAATLTPLPPIHCSKSSPEPRGVSRVLKFGS